MAFLSVDSLLSMDPEYNEFLSDVVSLRDDASACARKVVDGENIRLHSVFDAIEKGLDWLQEVISSRLTKALVKVPAISNWACATTIVGFILSVLKLVLLSIKVLVSFLLLLLFYLLVSPFYMTS